MSELTPEAKAEITEAVRIVASDKGYGMMRQVRDHLIPPSPENDPPKGGEPSAPPKKEDEGDTPPAPKKVGLWPVGNSDES